MFTAASTTEPLWDTSATRPGSRLGGISPMYIAEWARGEITPMQLGPHTAIPYSAATSVIRSRIFRQASTAALPLRSAPLDAAVAEVLLFFSVDVIMTMTSLASMANSSATSWRILVFTPCPISVAPVETCTVPSR